MSPRLKNILVRAALLVVAAYLGCIAGRATFVGFSYFTEFEVRELHPFAAAASIALAAVSVPAMFFLMIAVVTSGLYLTPRFPLWTWCVPFVAYAVVAYSVLMEFKGF